MFKELCSAIGDDRFRMISELKFRDIEWICRRVKNCKLCPLALHYTDKNNVERVCCVDVASRRLVEEVLREGGHFIELKEL